MKKKFLLMGTDVGCNLPKKETGQNLVENVPEFVEYMQEDDTAYHNAVATAEGAVAEAILHSTINHAFNQCIKLQSDCRFKRSRFHIITPPLCI